MFYSQIVLQSDLSAIGAVDAFLEGIMQDFGIGEEFFGVMSVPLIECVKNSMMHGNKMDENKKVSIDFQIKEAKLLFTVTDEGQGFDYEKTLASCADAAEKTGLFLLTALAEEVTFSKNGAQVSYKIDVPFSINSPVNRMAILQQKANREAEMQIKLQCF